MKRITIPIILIIVVSAVVAFILRGRHNREAKAQPLQAQARADQPEGYYITGRIVAIANGREEVLATWVKQGDNKRGWRMDQNYLDKQGRANRQIRQWCIVGQGVFIQNVETGNLRKLGPCNLYPPDYDGVSGEHMNERAIVRFDTHEGSTFERLVSPRLGTVLKLTHTFPKGTVVRDEALTINYQSAPDDIFVLP